MPSNRSLDFTDIYVKYYIPYTRLKILCYSIAQLSGGGKYTECTSIAG